MNLLEAFHFIFEADASKLEEGLEKAQKTNDKLKTSVVDTDSAAEKLGGTFLTLAKNAATLFTGVLAVGALKTMSVEIAEQTNALADQAKELNVNAGALFNWQNAVVASGGTAEGFNSTLANLNKITRDPEKTLMRLADQFKRLSSFRARKMGEQLGIDAGTSELLRKGRDGVAALIQRQKELGTVTTEQLEISQKYKDQLRDTNRVFDDVKRQVAMVILPIMTKWFEVLEKGVRFLRDNKPFTIAFFAGVAGVITALYLPAMLRAVAATYALIAPYLLIGGAVALVAGFFALLADDIYHFLQGNDSVIGRLSQQWPWVGQLVRDTADEFKFLWGLLKEFGQFMIDLFTDPGKAWEKFKSDIMWGINALAEKFPTLAAWAEKLKKPFESAGDAIKLVFKGIEAAITAAFNVLKKGWDTVVSWLPDSLKAQLGITVEPAPSQIAATPEEQERENKAGFGNQATESQLPAIESGNAVPTALVDKTNDLAEDLRKITVAVDVKERRQTESVTTVSKKTHKAEKVEKGQRKETPQNAPQATQTSAGTKVPPTPPQADSGREIRESREKLTLEREKIRDSEKMVAIEKGRQLIERDRLETDTSEKMVAIEKWRQLIERDHLETRTSEKMTTRDRKRDTIERIKEADALRPAPTITRTKTPAASTAPPQMDKAQQAAMAAVMTPAKQTVNNYSNFPLNSTTSNIMRAGDNRSQEKKTYIKIDTIEVKTQAQDAEGISKAIEGGLQDQFAATTADLDDGFLS